MSNDTPPSPGVTGEELQTALRVLARVAADRATLALASEAQRIELQKLAGEVARPDLKQRKRLQRALLRQEARARRERDEALRGATGIRALRAQALFTAPLAPGLSPGALPRLSAPGEAALPQTGSGGEEDSDAQEDAASPTRERATLHEARKCYVCKQEYRVLHAFYDQLCPACGDLSYQKRFPAGDLRGHIALVTGARVKIGYYASLLLLRNGCRVIVTTRFPRDAAARYAREPDFERFRERLSIFGLDLRHTPSVERFAAHLLDTLPRLDYLIHNACQTVRRPPDFYAHLVEGESSAPGTLAPAEAMLLQDYEALREQARDAGLHAPAALSQVQSDADRLLPDPEESLRALFPAGQYDADRQQVDLRTHNSWRLTLAEVPTFELLEVLLVNAVAPFVLSARLKSLLARTPADPPSEAGPGPFRHRHIVNVSAMEGQFYREHKTDKHPHTNMAKAALNMLTRTSAQDYVRQGIYMNAVDTGWVTDEDPAHLAEQKVEEHRFSPPLDVVDGAARIVDPIFAGLDDPSPPYGQFFKDYAPAPW